MRSDYIIPIIIIYVILLTISFNTVFFHTEHYASMPHVHFIEEYTHGPGYYIGLVAVAFQLVGSMLALVIIKNKVKEKESLAHVPPPPPPPI
jgi:hypothetical protein